MSVQTRSRYNGPALPSTPHDQFIWYHNTAEEQRRHDAARTIVTPWNGHKVIERLVDSDTLTEGRRPLNANAALVHQRQPDMLQSFEDTPAHQLFFLTVDGATCQIPIPNFKALQALSGEGHICTRATVSIVALLDGSGEFHAVVGSWSAPINGDSSYRLYRWQTYVYRARDVSWERTLYPDASAGRDRPFECRIHVYTYTA